MNDYEIINGERKLTKEARIDIAKAYLGNLYPTGVNAEIQRILTSKIAEKAPVIKTNPGKPVIIVWKQDYPKAVFTSLLVAINQWTGQRYSYAVTDVMHLTNSNLNGDYMNPAEEYDAYPILLVTMNRTEVKNYFNAQIVRSIAYARKMKGQRTYFFFLGTTNDLSSQKWTVDEMGDGTCTSLLTNYIDTITLNDVDRLNEIMGSRKISVAKDKEEGVETDDTDDTKEKEDKTTKKEKKK